MKTYVVLLRGVNVSGQKMIKMADLKAMFEELNFTNVQTYIQSGNVIFDSESSDIKSVKDKIRKKIKSEYGFDVAVVITTNNELGYVLSHNPFIKKKSDIEKMYVTFLAEKPAPTNVLKLNETDYLPEEFSIDDNFIYLFLPNGSGKAKLNNNFFENKLKVSTTTRNWKSVNTLFELSRRNLT